MEGGERSGECGPWWHVVHQHPSGMRWFLLRLRNCIRKRMDTIRARKQPPNKDQKSLLNDSRQGSALD
jgi:hypothetical protein